MKLTGMAEEIEKLGQDVRISQLSGSVGGFVGGGLVLAGIIAAPFTFGASLGLTIAGASLGVVGATTGIGATVAGTVITNNKMAESETCLKTDLKMTQRVEEKVCTILHTENSQENDKDHMNSSNTSAILSGITSGRIVGGIGSATERILAISAKASIPLEIAGRVVSVTGIVLNSAFILVDAGSIIWHSIQLAKDDKPEAALEIWGKVKQLTEHKEAVEEFHDWLETLENQGHVFAEDESPIPLKVLLKVLPIVICALCIACYLLMG